MKEQFAGKLEFLQDNFYTYGDYALLGTKGYCDEGRKGYCNWMKYFVDEEKRKASHSTCYFEFQMGYYHDKFWLPDSISIHDSLWDEYHLSDLIGCVIKDFDYYGITIVTKTQWEEIVRLSQKSGSIWEKVIAEAVPWVNECFKRHEVFTILGM